MTEEERQNKELAWWAAQIMKAKEYCNICPVSKGCTLDLVKDDVECYVRFHNWLDGTHVICKRI